MDATGFVVDERSPYALPPSYHSDYGNGAAAAIATAASRVRGRQQGMGGMALEEQMMANSGAANAIANMYSHMAPNVGKSMARVDESRVNYDLIEMVLEQLCSSGPTANHGGLGGREGGREGGGMGSQTHPQAPQARAAFRTHDEAPDDDARRTRFDAPGPVSLPSSDASSDGLTEGGSTAEGSSDTEGAAPKAGAAVLVFLPGVGEVSAMEET